MASDEPAQADIDRMLQRMHNAAAADTSNAGWHDTSADQEQRAAAARDIADQERDAMNQRPSITQIALAFMLAALIVAVPAVSILTQSLTPVWIGLGILGGLPFLLIGFAMLADRRRGKLTDSAIEDLAAVALNRDLEPQAGDLKSEAHRRSPDRPGYDPFDV